MSFHAEAQVWESEEARALPHGLRLLLLRVAHIVNPENDWLLWARPEKLAWYTGLDDVARGLRKLRDAGWLEVVDRGRPGVPTTYRWAKVPAGGPGEFVPASGPGIPASEPGKPDGGPGLPAGGPDAPLYTTEVEQKGTEALRAAVIEVWVLTSRKQRAGAHVRDFVSWLDAEGYSSDDVHAFPERWKKSGLALPSYRSPELCRHFRDTMGAPKPSVGGGRVESSEAKAIRLAEELERSTA